MLSLDQLPSPPGLGEVTACETEGVLRAQGQEAADRLLQTMLGGGAALPTWAGGEHVRPAHASQDARLAFTASPRLPTSIPAALRERGLVGALELIHEHTRDASAPLRLAGWGAACLRQLLSAAHQADPRRRTYSTKTQGSIGSSSVVDIAWHPVCLRLALASSDDSVRVLSSQSAPPASCLSQSAQPPANTSLSGPSAGSQSAQPLLKHRLQRGVHQIAWIPHSLHTLAVSCEAGVLLWSLDPASVVSRPSGACVTLLPTAPAPGPCLLSPHPLGVGVAVSGGAGVAAWDTALLRSVTLQRRGRVTELRYSPDGEALLVLMSSPNVLRIFSTADWSHEDWVCPAPPSAGHWSPCSRHAVFAAGHTLYGVSVNGGATATPLLDLTAAQLTDADGDSVSVGGAVRGVAWAGQRLAVLFHGCPYVVLLTSCTKQGLRLALGGVIKGPDDAVPLAACFRPAAAWLLSVAWSDDSLQHVPLCYAAPHPAAPDHSHGNATAPFDVTAPPSFLGAPTVSRGLLTPAADSRAFPADTSAYGGDSLFSNSIFSPIRDTNAFSRPNIQSPLSSI